MRDKKAMMGLDTVKVVLVVLLTLGVIAIAMFVALTSLQPAVESLDRSNTGTVTNESTTKAMNYTWTYTFNTSISGQRNPTCTITSVINGTDGVSINSGNYTVPSTLGGCNIKASTPSAGFNSTVWKVSYTYVYASPDSYNAVSNITNGSVNFFKQIPTVFTILGVIVIILAVGIIIVAVMRFGNREDSM